MPRFHIDATVDVTVMDVEAEDEDEAYDIARSALERLHFDAPGPNAAVPLLVEVHRVGNVDVQTA